MIRANFYFSILETAKDVMLETRPQTPTKTEQRQSVENVGRELQKPTEEHHDASSSIKSSENRIPKLRQLLHGNFKVLSLSLLSLIWSDRKWNATKKFLMFYIFVALLRMCLFY